MEIRTKFARYALLTAVSIMLLGAVGCSSGPDESAAKAAPPTQLKEPTAKKARKLNMDYLSTQ